MANAVKYLANVGRSVKYAAVDVLKEMNPVVTDVIETNQDVAKITYSSIKNYKTLSAKAMKSLSQSQVGELAKDLKKNIFEDIKSGNFYNRKRQEAIDAKIGASIYGSDLEDFMVDDDFSNDDFSADDKFNESEFLADAMDDTAERASTAVSKVLARTSEYQVEATRQSTNRVLAQTAAMSAQLHTDLGVLNTNIAGVVKFNNEAMATHIENSRAFYERQQEQMSEQTNILKEMLELQKSIYIPKTKDHLRDDGKVRAADLFTSTGAINLPEYLKLIKQNIKAQDAGYGDMLKEAMESGSLKSMAANPLKFIATGAVRAVIPKVLEESFKEFNETIAGSMSSAILKISKQKNSVNPIASFLGSILGVNLDNNPRLDSSKYNKGPVPWSGTDHKALTEVIPTLLNKIYSAVSGTNETRYDYEKGRFVSIKDIKKSYKDSKNRFVSGANDTLMDYFQDAMNQIDFGNMDNKKDFVRVLETMMKQNFKNMRVFNPNDKSMTAKTYGLKGANDEYYVQLIKQMVSQMPKHKQLKQAGDLFDQQAAYRNFIETINEEGTSMLLNLANGSIDKKKKTTPVFAMAGKIDTTNTILADIYDLLYDKFTGNKRARIKKRVANHKTVNNVTNISGPSVKKKTKTNNEGTDEEQDESYRSELGFYVADNNGKDNMFKMGDDPLKFELKDSEIDNKTYLKRLKEAKTPTQKMFAFLSGTKELVQSPMSVVANILRKADERVYTLLFGDENNKKSILGKITDGIDFWLDDLKDNIKNRFEDLKDWLHDKDIKDKANDVLSRLLDIDTKEWFANFREAAFGSKNMTFGEGIRKIFSEGFSDMWKGFKNFFKTEDTKNASGQRKTGNREEQFSAIKEVENSLTNPSNNKIGNMKVVDESELVDGAAKGGIITKTGLIAASEGEIIIPPDMSANAIRKRDRAEKSAIAKFKKAYKGFDKLGFGEVQNFAAGGVVGEDNISPERKIELNQLINDIEEYATRTDMSPEQLGKIMLDMFKAVRKKEERAYVLGRLSQNARIMMHKVSGDVKENVRRATRLKREDYEEGKEPIYYKMMDAAKDIGADAKENVYINQLMTKISSVFEKNKKATGEGKEVVSDIMKNFGNYLPRMAAGGVTGLAVSTLLGLAGGPLLGAAVGSGLGLLSNNKKLQKFLFGEKSTDEEGNLVINGGVFNDNIKKNVHKYFPGMSKGAIVGGIASVLPFVPGGPVAGILIGSAVGYARTNEEMKEKLFGKDKFLGKMEKTIKEKLPRMGLGAAAMFLGGPFGLTTNLIVGSALGFVSDTEKFKSIVFGTKGSNGERTGGLVGFIKEAAEVPLKNIMTIFNDTRVWFKDKFLSPLGKFIKPATRQLENIGSWFKNAIFGGIREHVAKPIGRKILNVLQPLEKITGGILRGLLFPIRGLISLPAKGLQGVGTLLRRHQLRNVGTASGTAAERLAEMEELDSKRPGVLKRFTNSKGYRSARMINGMSNDELLDAQDALVALKGYGKKSDKKRALNNISRRAIGKEDEYFFNDLKQKADKQAITTKMYKYIYNAVLAGDDKKARDLVMNLPLNPDKGLTAEERESFAKRAEKAATISAKSQERAQEIAEKIRKDAKLYGVDYSSYRFGKEIEQEIKGRGITVEDKERHDEEKDSTEETAENTKTLVDINTKNHIEVINSLDYMGKLLYKIAYPDSDIDIPTPSGPKAKANKKEEPKSENKNNQEGQDTQLPATLEPQLQVSLDQIMQDGSSAYANSIANGTLKPGRLKSMLRKINTSVKKRLKTSKSVITENGPIKTKIDPQGNEVPDMNDSETRETMKKVEEKESTQQGILSKLSGLGDTIKGFLGFGKDGEEKEEESLFSKILKGALKYALPVLGTLAGAGLVSRAMDAKVKVKKRDKNGNVLLDENGNPVTEEKTIAEAVKDGAARMWLGDDLTGNTNGAWFHIKDFTTNQVIPLLQDGFNLITQKLPDILMTATQHIVENAPTLLMAIGTGIGKGIWNVLKGILSNIPGIGKFFKGDKDSSGKGSSSSKASTNPDSGTTTLTVNPSGTKPSSSGKTASKNDIANTKNSMAYQNAPKSVQDKATNQVAQIWNSQALDDGTTVGELLNDDQTVVAQYTDDNGNVQDVTGADLLMYPEAASQLLGIDVGLTEEERNANSQDVRNATKSDNGTSTIVKIIASGGMYGKGAARTAINVMDRTGKALMNPGKWFKNTRAGKAGSKLIGKIKNIPLLGSGLTKAGNVAKKIGGGIARFTGLRKVGKVAKGLSTITGATVRANTIPLRATEAFRSGVEDFNNLKNAYGLTNTQAAQYMAGRLGADARTGIRGIQDKFNQALDNRSAKRWQKVSGIDEATGLFAGAKNKYRDIKKSAMTAKNKALDKLEDKTIRRAGNAAADAATSATEVSKNLSSIKSAMGRVLGKTDTGKKAMGAVGQLSEKGKQVVNMLKKVLGKFLSDNKVVKQLAKVIQCGKSKKKVTEELIEKGLKEFAEKIVEKFTKGLAKKGAKVISKMAIKLGAYIGSGGLIAVAFIVADFVSGMSKADAILEVEEPTIAERFVAGIVNALLNACFLGLVLDTKDLVNFAINMLEKFGLNFDDLRKRQEEAKINCEEYNREHGTNYTVEEYLMSDHLSTKIKTALGKVGEVVGGAAKGAAGIAIKIGSAPLKLAAEGAKAAVGAGKAILGGAAKAVKSIGSGIASLFSPKEVQAASLDEESEETSKNATEKSTVSKVSKITGDKIENATKVNNAGNINSENIDEYNKENGTDYTTDNTTETTENTTSESELDQVQLATSGEGSVISNSNQEAINKAYSDVNASIPNMIRQLKANLASYFGINPSDMNRTTKIGANTMKASGPKLLFNNLKSMWSKVNTTIGPFTRQLPKTMYSGMEDLSRFLAVSMGFADPEDNDVDLNEIVNDESYVDNRAQQVATGSPFAWMNGVSGSASPNKKTQEKSMEDMASGKKSNSETFTSKITTGAKKFINAIGNFFGIGGKGSGIDDDQAHIIENTNAADSPKEFISQKYGEYAKKAFTVRGDNKRETVADAGCAPAVATMAINTAGFSAKPITMTDAMKDALEYKQPNSGVTADYFVDEFDRHGLNTAFVTSQSPKMADTIISRLKSGNPIILMGKDEKNRSKSASPFGPITHYVVATGASNDGSTIYVNDPEANKPKIPYKASTLLKGVMLGIAPKVRSSSKNRKNSMVTKIKRLLAKFSASGKYGEDTIEYKVWTGLRAAGYSEITVAGTMGNIYAESRFDPSVVEHGNGIGFGLIQWSFGRRTAIENYANEKGEDPNSAELQIEWLIKECDPNDSAFAWMNSSTSYDGKSWTYDEWVNATDIESAVRSFMFCFERPAGTSSLQKRIDAANGYYEEFTGTKVPSKKKDRDDQKTETTEEMSPLEQLLNAFSNLAAGYGLTGADASGSTEDNSGDDDLDLDTDAKGIKGHVSSNKEYAKKQVALVKKMKSVEGQIQYSWGPGSKYPGPSRNPDDGYGDCSSTVQWAYQKVLGVDPGYNTWSQEASDQTYTVTNTTADEDKMQLGDIILKNGHVEMYYGDGKMIGHGGGSYGKTPGPTIKKLGSTPPYNNIKRWVGFKDATGSAEFDGGEEGGSGSGLFVSQTDPNYANKKIGDRTVADAGCAPAVATMAMSGMNKNYNMNTAIKDAAKYQNTSGKVTVDYFADTYLRNGVKPSFIVNNVDKLKNAISAGNVVLLGKDSKNRSKTSSPFGPAGHYVLATGLSKDGKYVYINDPESKTSNKRYPINILSKASLGISALGGSISKINAAIRNKLKGLAGVGKYKYVFSGDSRTVGISLSVASSRPEIYFVAKAGIGYQWMKDHALDQIYRRLDEDNSVKAVFLYGVNDMININYYLKKYKEIESKYDKNRIWYVSVNPIEGKQLVTDEQIQDFNKQLKEFAGDRYIDTYTMLKDEGFGSPDGLHYDNETNVKICDFIIDAISNGNTSSSSSDNEGTETEQRESPLSKLLNEFNNLAAGYGLKGKTKTVSSGDDSDSDDKSTTGSEFPKYDLSDEQKNLAAGVIAGETGGSDLVAAKQEASQMANLNEVQYGKEATGSNLESTLKGGWYAKASLSKSPTDTTLKAVEDVLINGKRTLPRYVTEHDMFPLDAAISGHWNNGKDEDRTQYERDKTIIHQNPSRFSSPANYKFYDFFGENKDGDVAGYYDQYYDEYKDDEAWSGAGSGLAKQTPSFDYTKSSTNTSVTTRTSTNKSDSNTTDKLIEVVVKLLSKVVDNTASIKDIASLLVKLVDSGLVGSGTGSDSQTAIKGSMTASQLALQALSRSAQSSQDEEIVKLIRSVESIATQ